LLFHFNISSPFLFRLSYSAKDKQYSLTSGNPSGMSLRPVKRGFAQFRLSSRSLRMFVPLAP